jgi:VCBS repeat-containing protein
MVGRASRKRRHLFWHRRFGSARRNVSKRRSFTKISQQLVFALVISALVITTSGRTSAQSGFYTLVPIVDPYLLGAGARDINDSGVVVGATSGVGSGYIWTQAGGGQPMPLFTDQGFASRLRINNNGVVAGGGCGSGVCQAEIWRADLGEVPLGYFPSGGGNQTSVATGINDQGQIVGAACCLPGQGWAPVIWPGLQALPFNAGGANGANDINSSGQVVGGIYANGGGETVMWSATGGSTTIPLVPNATGQEGLRINDSGVVVGRTFLAPDNHGGMFRWSPETGTEDLNALGAPEGAVAAIDLNNLGDIVVSLILPTGGGDSYLYSNGVWTNIDDLVPPGSGHLTGVTAINNRGWIIGGLYGYSFLLIPPNRVPAATDDILHTIEDTAANGTLKATDPDNDSLTYSIVANGTLGTATITNPATGAFTYTPNPDANGTDAFTFKVSDGTVDSNVATETMTISPINDAPVAANGTASVNAGASVTGTLVATDVDSANLTYVLLTNGAKGTATITNAGTGAYTYAASTGSTGTDTFTFKANDGFLDSNAGTITVTITSCAANISSTVMLSQGPIKIDKKTGRYTQTITLKNADGAVAGPVSLVLDALSPNGSLFGGSGTTACAAPLGSAYVNVDVGADGLFSARERATVTLEFLNPSGQPITYTPRVLAGGGAR